jgi:hypothetical protein
MPVKLPLLAALLFFFSFSLKAAPGDWRDIASRSDRSADSMILQAMNGDDLETALQLCEGVGSRSDPYAADIIESLAALHKSTSSSRSELLLRVLLSGLFDTSRSSAEIRDRSIANAAALETLFARIRSFKDFQLIGILLGVLPYRQGDNGAAILMEVGARLISDLGGGNGLIPSQEIALGFDYLAGVEQAPSPDFLDQCVSIARLSREKVLMDRARTVAAALASR